MPGVFLKPIVRQEMDGYVDGWGNKRDWRNYTTDLNVQKLTVQPNPFQQSITYRAMVTSEEPRDPNNSIGAIKNVRRKDGSVRRAKVKPKPKRFIQYLVTVRFHDLKFKDVESVTSNQKWEVAGRTVFSRTPTIAANKAMVKCQCRDFMLTWERPLALSGGLWPNNRWTRYERLTPRGTGYPERNPKEKMGYCKHVATLLQHMYDKKMVKNK
jgi:hypothetical protein